MKKELKDYLHLYLGCDVSLVLGLFKLIGVEENAAIIYNKMYGRKIYSVGLIKPILRPLSDISKDEWNEIEQSSSVMPDAWGYNGIKDNFLIDTPNVRFGWRVINETLIELRKRSVDVDGLIESGLAIDKTTLKP